MGGYTTAKKEVIELLRQRSRPIYFHSLAPAIVGATIKVLNYWKRHHFKRQIRTPKFQGRNEKSWV
jgi:7-keto-8-aminopelargonate synthetase-like enzyme